MTSDHDKTTDDVAGAASAASPGLSDGAPTPSGGLADGAVPSLSDGAPTPSGEGADPDATADPPPAVAELAAACVRFVFARYQVMLDFSPETLSLVDQWLRDGRVEVRERPETVELVQAAAGAYLGEVVRRAFGGRWKAETEREHADWRLGLSTVYCAFNPIGMAREALLLEPADGWRAHLELDPGEREGIEARLAALPEVGDDEYYAPSTRFDVVSIVFDALREGLRSRGLGDVRFGPEDYD